MASTTQTFDVQADCSVTLTQTISRSETLVVEAAGELRFDRGVETLTVTGVGVVEAASVVVSPLIGVGSVSLTEAVSRSETFVVDAAGVVAITDYHAVPSQDRYELFVSSGGAAVDFTTPDETFTSLPHTTGITLASGQDHELVIRRRNQYGLSSQNVVATRIVVDGAGDARAPDPSSPVSIEIEQISGNKARITADYYAVQDGSDVATKWLAYVTTDGSDPSLAAPTVTAMTGHKRGLRRLVHDTGALGDAVQVRARVATRLTVGGSDFDSDLSDEATVTISTAGPPAPAEPQVKHFAET